MMTRFRNTSPMALATWALRLRWITLAAVIAATCTCTAAVDIKPIEISAGGMVFEALAAGPDDGELVVLLHGFPQTAYSYRHQIPALARAGYRVVAPNQRGYSPGARPEAVEDYAMGKLVEDVTSIVDVLGYERFHLVGHDWGGAVAWVVAMRFPQRLQTLTVLSTPHVAAFGAGVADTASEQAEKSSYMEAFGAPGAEEWFLADDAAFLRSIYDETVFSEAEVEVYLKALGNPEALRGALNWYSAMQQPPPPPSPAAGDPDRGSPPGTSSGTPPQGPPPIQTPTLYVWGTEDMAFARLAAEATRDFVAGPYRFVEMEGMGHWLAEQAGERVTALILEQLQAGQRE